VAVAVAGVAYHPAVMPWVAAVAGVLETRLAVLAMDISSILE
jgi:hypothetical protein